MKIHTRPMQSFSPDKDLLVAKSIVKRGAIVTPCKATLVIRLSPIRIAGSKSAKYWK